MTFADSDTMKLAERLAEQAIHQWDKHDRYRMTDGEHVLFENKAEPNEVAVARALTACLRRIRLAECQHLGCGGTLMPSEIVAAMRNVLNGVTEGNESFRKGEL